MAVLVKPRLRRVRRPCHCKDRCPAAQLRPMCMAGATASARNSRARNAGDSEGGGDEQKRLEQEVAELKAVTEDIVARQEELASLKKQVLPSSSACLGTPLWCCDRSTACRSLSAFFVCSCVGQHWGRDTLPAECTGEEQGERALWCHDWRQQHSREDV